VFHFWNLSPVVIQENAMAANLRAATCEDQVDPNTAQKLEKSGISRVQIRPSCTQDAMTHLRDSRQHIISLHGETFAKSEIGLLWTIVT
jgi:hypothetical protein